MADISVSLTQFLDFTLKGSGTAKANYIKRVKSQPDYHPALDYWKQLRDEIRRVHENGLDVKALDELVQNVDKRKQKNYHDAVKQYKKFLKGKEVEWFEIGKAHWAFDDLLVRSTPEIGLKINNEPHLVKLYFKGNNERIDKHNISSTLTLMNKSIHSATYTEGTIHSVLNVQKNRLYQSEGVNDDMLISLEGEASHFIYLWRRV